MDVTPVSLQMIVPRATEVGQIQHNLNQAASLQQDFESMREQADAKLKETQVRSKANPEDGRIRDEQQRQQGQGYQGDGGQSRKEQDAEEEETATSYAVDPTRGHHLDISL